MNQVIMQTKLTLEQQTAFISSLAPARLAKFRAVFGGRDRDAVELYLLDAALVSHMHAVVRTVEVTLREAMHDALSSQYGPRWYDTQATQLDKRTNGMVEEAKKPLGRSPSPGKVVAQLMLGTWVTLLDRGGSLEATPGRADYEQFLWDPALSSVFSAGKDAPSRSEVHRLVRSINWARNRINHCEPVVFGFPQQGQSGSPGTQERHSPAKVLENMRSLMGQINPPLGSWLSQPAEIDDLVNSEKAQQALKFAMGLPRVFIVQ